MPNEPPNPASSPVPQEDGGAVPVHEILTMAGNVMERIVRAAPEALMKVPTNSA